MKYKSSKDVKDALKNHAKVLKYLEKKLNEGTRTNKQLIQKIDEINCESEVKFKKQDKTVKKKKVSKSSDTLRHC